MYYTGRAISAVLCVFYRSTDVTLVRGTYCTLVADKSLPYGFAPVIVRLVQFHPRGSVVLAMSSSCELAVYSMSHADGSWPIC